MNAPRILALSVMLAASGCSWIQATPGDHAAYRDTRTQQTLPQRLAAASDYLDEYPEGAYVDHVKRYYSRAEPIYFDSRKDSERGLLEYLHTLPKGPHAADARQRLATLAQQRKDPLLRAAEQTRLRLGAAKTGRKAAQDLLAGWIEASLDPALYQSALAEAPREFLLRYSLALPEAVCELPDDAGSRVCRKDESQLYAVPTPQGLSERELSFIVEVVVDPEGRPSSVSLIGSELFARLDETYALGERDQTSIKDSIEANVRAVDFVSGLYENKISSEPACRQAVTAPTLLRLSCGGVQAEAVAARDLTESDEIRFRPRSP